jgi:hypothetical protein
MKRIVNLFIFIGIIAALATYSSCSPNNPVEVPITDQQLQKLIGASTATKFTWKLASATLDGVDKMVAPTGGTADYSSAFTITFSGTIGATPATTVFNYTTSKPLAPLSPWPVTGTFTFDKTNPSTTVTRGDDTVITYEVSETQLRTSFNFTSAGYPRGRTDVVKGQWIFTFTK